MLPLRAQKLIREFSKPLTRPDWRTIKPGCVGKMYKEIMRYKNKTNKYDKYYILYNRFTMNVQHNYYWHNLCEYVKKNGIIKTSEDIGINIKVLRDIVY